MNNELEMIAACQMIGGVAECNCHFQAGLAQRIEATGKALEELTIGEFLVLIRSYSDWYNQIHSIKGSQNA